MEVKVKTAPAKEPLNIDEVKNYIKYDDSAGDEISLITRMIKSARRLSEKYLNLALAQQTLVCYFDRWDVDLNKFELPYSPHSRIVSLYSKDLEEKQTELILNKNFYKKGNSVFEIELLNTIGTGTQGSYDYTYECEYICGYGITIESGGKGQNTEDLPDPIIMAMLKQIAVWYDNRESWQPVMDMSVKELLKPFARNPYI